MTGRPATTEYASFYHRYIEHVPDGDILQTLSSQLAATTDVLRSIGEERAPFRYAPGKWSVRQVVGHLADTERVMSYRALRFARNDATGLPGFDENIYAEHAGSDDRRLADLITDLTAVRAATVALFAGLPAEAWARGGPANNVHITVRALAWILAGHELHHRNILQTRYV